MAPPRHEMGPRGVEKPPFSGLSLTQERTSPETLSAPSSLGHEGHNPYARATSEPTDVRPTQQQQQHRHLNLWDLLAIGVGGTVGSGIFVLTGQIAVTQAGPATCWSFLLAGSAALASGVCYAELSGRIPLAGSAYRYAQICLGPRIAVTAAACLTLEYAVSGAAVARTWGDKVLLYLSRHAGYSDATLSYWQPLGGLCNIPAALLSAVSSLLLWMGVGESKGVTNFFSLMKMLLVCFMIVAGLILYQPSNMPRPWIAHAPLKARGVVRGATSAFFGYLGYDEVACVAGEALDPVRDMPRAVLGTLVLVTLCYFMAAIALTGMVSWQDMNATSGFPEAFAYRHLDWAAHLTGLGEIFTLPVVVLISLMAQPRLSFSMALDGILPSWFQHVDNWGNLRAGTAFWGASMTAVAAFTPFSYLDDLISSGILLSFSITNCCLVILRCESPTNEPGLLETCLLVYNLLCFLTSLLWTSIVDDDGGIRSKAAQQVLAVVSTVATVFCFLYMAVRCRRSDHFGESVLVPEQQASGDIVITSEATYFATPMVPFLPCLGMAINWYLIAQLEIHGIVLLCLYVGLVSATYPFWSSCCTCNALGSFCCCSVRRRGSLTWLSLLRQRGSSRGPPFHGMDYESIYGEELGDSERNAQEGAARLGVGRHQTDSNHGDIDTYDHRPLERNISMPKWQG